MAIHRPSHGWEIKGITTSPGEMLMEEFLKPLGISQNRLALAIRVPSGRITQIVHGTRAITPDTALRLARYFGNSPDFWMNLQQSYDLSKARVEIGKKIENEIDPLKRTA